MPSIIIYCAYQTNAAEQLIAIRGEQTRPKDNNNKYSSAVEIIDGHATFTREPNRVWIIR